MLSSLLPTAPLATWNQRFTHYSISQNNIVFGMVAHLIVLFGLVLPNPPDFVGFQLPEILASPAQRFGGEARQQSLRNQLDVEGLFLSLCDTLHLTWCYCMVHVCASVNGTQQLW